MKRRYLVLEDGTYYVGYAIGSNQYKIGELVFNTGMSGYQEVLTDLSYCGQIITMTYPLIGNYGINCEDFESLQPAAFGFVVKSACNHPSNWRSKMTLDEFLKQKNIPGICGVDTRALTRKIRTSGTMKATMCDELDQLDQIVLQLKNSEEMHNHVDLVSTKNAYVIPNESNLHVVLMDFGAKHGICRELAKRGCKVSVVPYTTTASEILAMQPDGVMLTNGPGDPKDMKLAIQTIQELIGKVVIFGICLGHQLISLACGANTSKLQFGHRGCNHPVLNLKTNKIELTSQNHGYAVEEESLDQTDLIVTHRALNDKSIEGVMHQHYPVFSVQYHPESAPGPHDSRYLFDQFISYMMENREDDKDE